MSTRAVNRRALRRAIEIGTRNYLRAGDALYVAAARAAEGQLVSWDRELVERAGALTPEEWLEAND